MSHLQVLEQRMDGSNYDPVIWEDIKPIETIADQTNGLLSLLIAAILDSNSLEELKEQVKSII